MSRSPAVVAAALPIVQGSSPDEKLKGVVGLDCQQILRQPSAPPTNTCARAGLHLRAATGTVQAACWAFCAPNSGRQPR